jgi:hypothetical protein
MCASRVVFAMIEAAAVLRDRVTLDLLFTWAHRQ